MNLFHPHSDKNKFGYYEVGDYRTYSKYDAIVVAEQQGKIPSWNFNDAVFSCYDWTQEPTESLQELYRRRAEQLRNKYDYLVLAFSGGSDSHNALMAFIKNGIHIDELMTFHTFEGNRGDRDSFQNAEVWRVAKPYGELLQSKYPGIKHRFVDLTTYQFQFWKDHPEAKFDFVYYGNACASIQNICRADLRVYIDDYRSMIESGKKLGIIFAVDKPEVRFENGRWQASFYDIVDHSVPPIQQINNRETDHSEFFYWSPDLPELVIKQCHEIKKYLLDPENVKKINQFPKINQWGYEVTESHVWYDQHRLTNDQIKTILYPYWSLDTFSIEKSPTGILFSKRDEWFYGTNLEQTEIYMRNAAKVLQIGKKWFNWTTIKNDNYKSFEGMLKNFIYPRQSEFSVFFKNKSNEIVFPKSYKIFNTRQYHIG